MCSEKHPYKLQSTCSEKDILYTIFSEKRPCVHIMYSEKRMHKPLNAPQVEGGLAEPLGFLPRGKSGLELLVRVAGKGAKAQPQILLLQVSPCLGLQRT